MRCIKVAGLLYEKHIISKIFKSSEMLLKSVVLFIVTIAVSTQSKYLEFY